MFRFANVDGRAALVDPEHDGPSHASIDGGEIVSGGLDGVEDALGGGGGS
jgi:hypothetical protein